jgi:hypothetical protein
LQTCALSRLRQAAKQSRIAEDSTNRSKGGKGGKSKAGGGMSKPAKGALKGAIKKGGKGPGKGGKKGMKKK